ncbi:MAG TPA: extracellular solute-binding protein [Nocardioidaceae bacterium]
MAVGRGVQTIAGAVALCALAAGCTTDPEPEAATSPSPVASSSATPEPVTVTLGVYGPAKSLPAYDEMAAAFTEQSPHVTVEVERYESAEEVLDAVDDEGAPDVFLMDRVHLPQLVEDELVQPVDGLLEERQVDFGDGYQRAGLTAFAREAALQCMPHDVSPLVVYYNEDLVDLDSLGTEETGTPSALDGWGWETFAAAARQASRGRANGVYLEPSLTSLAPFVWSTGGDIVDNPETPTTLTLSSDEAREALEQVLALVRDPLVVPTGDELDEEDAVTRFKRGRLGMIVGSRALTPVFREAEDLSFDVMPLPSLGRFRTAADMTGYCISSGTEQVQAAGDLLAFAVSRDGATITTRPGYVVPSNLEVAHSGAFTQATQPPRSSFIFNEGVRRTQPLPYSTRWPDLVEHVEPDLDRMFYDPVIDLDAMLEDVDAESVEVLAPEEE